MFRIPFRKAVAVAATSAVALTGLILAAPGVAHANGPKYRLAAVSSPGFYLDVQNGSRGDGAPIIQWSLSGNNQVWTLQPSGSHFELVNKNSGKCLTTDGVAGNQVYQWYCHGTPNQLWDTGLIGNNLIGYPIASVASGLYLEVKGRSGALGASIDTWYYNGGDNQFFIGLGA